MQAGQRGEVRKGTEDCRVLPSYSRHSVARQMHHGVGKTSMSRFANDLSYLVRVIGNIVA